jgi:hypothetical protein
MEQQSGGPGPRSSDPALPLRPAEAAYGPEELAREGGWDAGETAVGAEPTAEGAEPTAVGAEPAAADHLLDEPDEQRPATAEPPDEQPPATGEPRVDAALARLGELAGRPVTEHRAIFEDVHRRLRDVLGELDTREPQSQDAGGAERRADR